MKKSVLAALAITLLVPVASAGAQACMGLPSLATRPMNAGVNAQFTDGAKTFGARLGFGSTIAFGGIGANLQSYDDVDGTGFGVGVDGGLSILGGTERNIVFCPMATLGYTKLPSDLDFSTTDGTLGIAIGSTLNVSPGLALVPFASLAGGFTRYNFGDDVTGDPEDSDSYGLFGGGLGLQLPAGLIIRPSFTIPFGISGSEAVYGIGIAFPLGTR